MEKFEQGSLHDFTPCLFTDRKEIIHAVAVVHAELVLSIPSGKVTADGLECWRCSWGCQAGLPPFDFGGIKGRLKQKYFTAVQAGMEYNYAPMEKIFMTVLKRTLRHE